MGATRDGDGVEVGPEPSRHPYRPGELSPDGGDYWDGSQWRPTLSPDGRWRWAGDQWVPVQPAPTGTTTRELPSPRVGGVTTAQRKGKVSRSVALAIAGGTLVALLAVLGVVALLVAHTGSLVDRSDVAFLCDEGAVKPGSTLATGDKVCGQSLGALVVSADFAANPAVPDKMAAIYTGDTLQDRGEALTSSTARASLHTGPSFPEAILLPAESAPVDVLVAVDFVAPFSGDSIGVAARCGTKACVMVRLTPDGKYGTYERAGSADSWKRLSAGDLYADAHYPAPRLNSGLNRLIVWAVGNQVGGSLNGRLIASSTVTVKDGQGHPFFFIDGRKQGPPAEVGLTRVSFFEAGGR